MSFAEYIDEILNKQRSEYSNEVLLMYYKQILYQVKYTNRSDIVLINYINELEFRNLKYRL